MPTTKLDKDSFMHKYYWEKYRDKVLQDFLSPGDNLGDLVLKVERVDIDTRNIDWKHRCPYCNDCRPDDYTWCKTCEPLHFHHNHLKNVYFLVDKFGGLFHRLIFYLKK